PSQIMESETNPMNHVELVEAEGHLVDSQILSNIMDRVIECGAVYEVMDFKLGRTNDEFSQLQMRVVAPTREILDRTLEELVELGCYQAKIIDATLKPAPEDHVAPDDFYSTTNHRTYVRVGGAWVEAAKRRLAAVVIVREEAAPPAAPPAAPLAECRKLRDVKKGEMVVCGANGVRIQPEFKERDRLGFA